MGLSFFFQTFAAVGRTCSLLCQRTVGSNTVLQLPLLSWQRTGRCKVLEESRFLSLPSKHAGWAWLCSRRRAAAHTWSCYAALGSGASCELGIELSVAEFKLRVFKANYWMQPVSDELQFH